MARAIWSSLFVLESTDPHVNSGREPARSYLSKLKGGTKHQRFSQRQQKLAAAIAFVGASLPNGKNVTACSVEISDLDEGGPTKITLRIAQNQLVSKGTITDLQSMVDQVVEEVSKEDWSDKKNRKVRGEKIATSFLLPLVMKLCKGKISTIIKTPLEPAFRSWEETIRNSNPMYLVNATKATNRLTEWLAVLQGLHTDDASLCVIPVVAQAILKSEAVTILEPHWRLFDQTPDVSNVHGTEGEEDEDEDEESGKADKSSIYRLLRKLARYATVCRTIVHALIDLRRSPIKHFNIVVETVPIQKTNRMPMETEECISFSRFCTDFLHQSTENLDSRKTNSASNSWGNKWKGTRLILHAEMQMALYYACNPQLLTICNFIGVSKRCCWCCDFVLNHLQTQEGADTRYSVADAGLPIEFSVAATHSRRYVAWLFPDPDRDISHNHRAVTGFDWNRLRRRFELVREDLEKALVAKVLEIMPELEKQEQDSDSSGLSADDHSDSSVIEESTDVLVATFLKKRQGGG